MKCSKATPKVHTYMKPPVWKLIKNKINIPLIHFLRFISNIKIGISNFGNPFDDSNMAELYPVTSDSKVQ